MAQEFEARQPAGQILFKQRLVMVFSPRQGNRKVDAAVADLELLQLRLC